MGPKPSAPSCRVEIAAVVSALAANGNRSQLTVREIYAEMLAGEPGMPSPSMRQSAGALSPVPDPASCRVCRVGS